MKYTSKRYDILLTARKLFWKFGIKRVTVEEICEEAGVSKMTFYKYFSNKMELVRTIMDVIMEGAMQKYRDIMDSDLPFKEKVLRSLELKRELTRTMSSEFFRDYMSNSDPEMVAYVQKQVDRNMRMIAADYAKAQEEGHIRKDIKVEFILYFLNHMMEMGHDEKLLALYASPQDLIMELTRFFFYGVLDRETKE